MTATATKLDKEILSYDYETASLSTRYKIEGASTILVAKLADGLPEIGDVYAGTALVCKKVQIEPEGARSNNRLYYADVTYEAGRKNGGKPSAPKAGDEWCDFSVSTQTVNVQTAYSQKKYGLRAPDRKNLINVNADGVAEGVDVPAPAAQIAVHKWILPSTFTTDYRRAIINEYANVNSGEWYGFDPGEVRFEGFSIVSRTETLYEIKFDFIIERNLTAEQLPTFEDKYGSFQISDGKKGHEYLETEGVEHVDETTKAKEVFTRGAYVSQVFIESDFSALNLSGVYS